MGGTTYTIFVRRHPFIQIVSQNGKHYIKDSVKTEHNATKNSGIKVNKRCKSMDALRAIETDRISVYSFHSVVNQKSSSKNGCIGPKMVPFPSHVTFCIRHSMQGTNRLIAHVIRMRENPFIHLSDNINPLMSLSEIISHRCREISTFVTQNRFNNNSK